MTNLVEYAALALQSYDDTEFGVSDATVAFRMSQTDFQTEAGSAGFSATAYLSDGKIVIAYRGTDDLTDIVTGWTTGAGFINQPQAQLAIKFYQAVAAEFPNMEIALTGHSLGGGLAGYVAALYGKEAVLFDNMAFEHATAAIASLADPNSENYIPELKEFIYGSANPQPIDLSGIIAYAEEGEILHINRLGQTVPVIDVSIGDDVPLGPVDRHLLPALLLALHADTLPAEDIMGWQQVSKYVFPHLFLSSGLAEAAEYSNVKEMATAIAYSTVSVTGENPVGIGAATTIFQNLHTFSTAATFGISIGTPVAGVNSAFTQIGGFVIGYASLLALPEYKTATPYDLLAVNETHGVMTIELENVVWESEKGANTKEHLVDALLDELYGYGHDSFNLELTSKSGEHFLPNIGEIQVALGLDSFDGIVEDHGTNVAVFLGTTFSDTILGSEGLDIIFAANLLGLGDTPANSDTIDGKGGDDVIVGSSGDDHLNGGSGSDMLFGGAGSDVLSGGTVTLPPGTGNGVVGDDKVGDYLAGGLGLDTYAVTVAKSDYSYFAEAPYYNVTNLSSRTDAWYRLSLNYIDTIYDADNSGKVSIHFDLGDQVFDEEFELDAFETFVNVPWDDRPNAFYDAYEWGYTGSGIWQVDNGALTGVIFVEALNSQGGFSRYAILQAGYGSYADEHNPTVAIELEEVVLVDGVSASGAHLFAGTNAMDTVTGGALADQLFGASADDTLSGLNGDDYLDGGKGNDHLHGGDGDDILLGRDGNDTLDGGDGNDTLVGHGGIDALHGGAGDDVITVDEEDVNFSGGDDYDTLVFSGSSAFIFNLAGSGFEAAVGGTGNDVITASNEGSEIFGGDGNDTLHGGDGNDVLTGGNGADVLDGAHGDDTISIDSLDISFTGGDGYDTLVYGGEESLVLDMEASGFESVSGGSSNDSIIGSGSGDEIHGSDGDDIIDGNGGSDTLDDGYGNDEVFAGDGDDTIFVGPGNNTIDGGGGYDTAYFQSVMGAALITDTTGQIRVEGAVWGSPLDTIFSGVEVLQFFDAAAIIGTGGSDVLEGTASANVFFGSTGNDVMYGHGGDDIFTYRSGGGSDTIIDDGGIDGLYDMIYFRDLGVADVSLSHLGDDLKILITATGDVITVKDQFVRDEVLNQNAELGLEGILFADNTSWNSYQITTEAFG